MGYFRYLGEVGNDNVNLVDALKSGISAKELTQVFYDQLKEAQGVVKKEQEAAQREQLQLEKKRQEEKEKALQETRKKVALAMVDYMDATGIIKKEDVDEDMIKTFLDEMKDIEKSYNIGSRFLVSFDELKSVTKQNGILK